MKEALLVWSFLLSLMAVLPLVWAFSFSLGQGLALLTLNQLFGH